MISINALQNSNKETIYSLIILALLIYFLFDSFFYSEWLRETVENKTAGLCCYECDSLNLVVIK